MKKWKRSNEWIKNYFFLIVPKPLKDELLSSWLVRVAIEHGQGLSSFLTLFVKKDGSSVSRTDIDFLYDENLFYYLSEKSDLSKQDILRMSLRSEEGYLFSCNGLYPPKQVRKVTDKRTHNGLMFCPKCLSEDKIPYYRKKWRYYFYNACPEHKVFLTDRCWGCHEKIRLAKINCHEEICFCSKCGKDLRLITTVRTQDNFTYGLKAIKWFENGLKNGYFIINQQKIRSLSVFESMTKICYLLNGKEGLKFKNFPLIDEYNAICKKLSAYSSKKTLSIQKDFILTAMTYHLFQNYPDNLLNFIRQNHMTYRDFTHDFKGIPFWYKEAIGKILPPQNKMGRTIDENEIIAAAKYLKNLGIVVNQKNVADIVGCHCTINSGFVRLYNKLNLGLGNKRHWP